ncbi:Uncharacterised protein [Escherichia coli]|uniref:Uncharacterized protein n=1 Tax=Escherichia coli TaxID=562 RepID=A0A485JL83_ECOLX|nr:Uncharacterised protein [Escherichia coli]
MSPDNISSAVNRFSGWPSNDPLKTDKESMTSPMTVQVIKMIAAILDPHRIVVGIDTLYTTQREHLPQRVNSSLNQHCKHFM